MIHTYILSIDRTTLTAPNDYAFQQLLHLEVTPFQGSKILYDGPNGIILSYQECSKEDFIKLLKDAKIRKIKPAKE